LLSVHHWYEIFFQIDEIFTRVFLYKSEFKPISKRHLQLMLNDLTNSSIGIGIRMNLDKTTLTFNEHVLPAPIAICGTVLKVVQKYVYLG
jgi:hypothetical protein